MDQHEVIRGLKRQLLIERSVFALIAVVALAWWAHGRVSDSKSFIMVNGKPVVCVHSDRDAQQVIQSVKQKTGCNPSEIEFREDVMVARAPRNARPVSRHKALRTVEKVLSPVFARWAIIVDGKPVVALPSRTIAGEALDLAKLRFGKLAKNLAEEPQFKENVNVDVAAVSPSIYCKSADEAVRRLFEQPPAAMRNGLYTVRKGDIASSIAERHGIKLAELWAINPGIDLHRLQIGDRIRIRAAELPKPKLTVVVRDQSDQTQLIPPPVQRVSTARLYAGKSSEISPGRPGLRRVKVATIYENGRKAGSEVISEEILREPEPRRIAVGIKPRP